MDLYKIDIKGTEFKVGIADNPNLRERGLSGLEKLGKTKGMLFIFPEEVNINMVMRDMNFNLDFIFVDKDWIVLQVGSLDKESEESITSETPCYMVLEVPEGTIQSTGLTVGDTITPDKKLLTQFKGVAKYKHGGDFEMIGDKVYEVLEDDIKADRTKMQILNDKGEVVSNIGSGATVFSREHTTEMIAKYKSGNTIDLADSFIKIINIHKIQKQDYVKK